MFDKIDQQYFEMRARISRDRALNTSDPAIRGVHEKMAIEYEGQAAAITRYLTITDDGRLKDGSPSARS